MKLVAERLDAPSVRFGEAEISLMDAAERAMLAMRGLVDNAEVRKVFKSLLRLPGNVGTEAHIATWTLEVCTPQRRESNRWPTIDRQARALVRAKVGIEGVVELTHGAIQHNQGMAAWHLAKYPELWARLRPILYSTDSLGRRRLSFSLAHDENSEADWCEGFRDDDRYRREGCVVKAAEDPARLARYLPLLRDMLVRDPNNQVRAAVIEALAGDPLSRNAIREILIRTTHQPETVPEYRLELQGAAVRALASDPESETLVQAYICAPRERYENKTNTLQKLAGIPRWCQMLLERLCSPDVSTDEINALARDPEAEASLLKLLESPDDRILHATVQALGARIDRARLIELLAHQNIQVRCAAIRALGQHSGTESLLREFLVRSPEERIAAAKALIHDAGSLESIQDNLLRYSVNNVRCAAVEVLGAHRIAFGALREYFDETRSQPENEIIQGGNVSSSEIINHAGLRGFILEKLAQDPRYYSLVKNSLDDPHPTVRARAVKLLANDPSMAEHLAHIFESRTLKPDESEAFCTHMSHHPSVRENLLRCLDVDLNVLRFTAFRYLVDHADDRQKLREMLSSTTASEGLRATMLGPLLRDPASIDIVRAAIDDSSERVKEEALRLLRNDPEVRNSLRERIRSLDGMAALARECLSPFYHSLVPGIIGSDPDAHPILADYLSTNDDDILEFVVPLLHNYPQAHPDIARLLSHSSARVQCAAIRALGAYEPVRVYIVGCLDPDPVENDAPAEDNEVAVSRLMTRLVLRRAATEAMKDIPEARHKFRTLLDDNDVQIRAAAIHSVAVDRSPEAVKLLKERVNLERDESLRLKLIEALGGDSCAADLLQERLYTDYSRRVRTSAASALGLGDLVPAFAVRDLPSIARIAKLLARTSCSELEELRGYLQTPRHLDLDAEPELGESVVAWCCARLTWAYEIERPQEGKVLGETATQYRRLSMPGRVIIIRVAMDAFDLPRERFLRPHHNLIETWTIARHLVAKDPPTVILACADVSFKHLPPPQLEPGEVRFGPTLFCFRINRRRMALSTEFGSDVSGYAVDF